MASEHLVLLLIFAGVGLALYVAGRIGWRYLGPALINVSGWLRGRPWR